MERPVSLLPCAHCHACSEHESAFALEMSGVFLQTQCSLLTGAPADRYGQGTMAEKAQA